MCQNTEQPVPDRAVALSEWSLNLIHGERCVRVMQHASHLVFLRFCPHEVEFCQHTSRKTRPCGTLYTPTDEKFHTLEQILHYLDQIEQTDQIDHDLDHLVPVRSDRS